jgi:hypothetical protein
MPGKTGDETDEGDQWRRMRLDRDVPPTGKNGSTRTHKGTRGADPPVGARHRDGFGRPRPAGLRSQWLRIPPNPRSAALRWVRARVPSSRQQAPWCSVALSWWRSRWSRDRHQRRERPEPSRAKFPSANVQSRVRPKVIANAVPRVRIPPFPKFDAARQRERTGWRGSNHQKPLTETAALASRARWRPPARRCETAAICPSLAPASTAERFGL